MFVGVSVRESHTVGTAQVAVQTGERGRNVMLAVQGFILFSDCKSWNWSES